MSVIYLLRRDFRIFDNLAMYKLTEYIYNNSIKSVYFVFIFTPEQTDPNKNKYYTQSGFDFMVSALTVFNKRIMHINFFYGDYIEQLENILESSKIKAVFFNHDYSAYAQKRDIKIFKLCKSHNVEVHAYHDLMLKGKLLEKGYKVMNAYVKRIKDVKLLKFPDKYINIKLYAKKLSSALSLTEIKRDYITVNKYPICKNPGSLVICSFKSGTYKTEGTRIGPYVKFGLISCRQLYLYKTSPEYKREVVIREFFYQCQAFYKEDIEAIPHNWKSPYVKSEYKLLEPELKNALKNKTDKQIIKSFYTQTSPYTKLPELIRTFITKLIDTNYLHNRERMMLATFLLHNLGLNWKLCEMFYAKNLRDYDPIINGLNWMWVLKVFFHTRPQIMKLKNFHY